MPCDGIRAGTQVVAVLEETTAFATKEATFDASKLRLPFFDTSFTFKHSAIENQAIRVDLGEHPPGVGLAHTEATWNGTTYVQGLGTAAGDGVAATANALTHHLCASLGNDPDLSTGSLVLTSTSTTVQVEDSAGSHGADQLVAFGVAADGMTYVRPVATYSTDTMTLAVELPSSPAVGDVIYGSATILNTETPSNFIAQGEAIGKRASDSWEWYGGVANLSLPSMSPGDAQTVTFNYSVADFLYKASSSQVAPASIGKPIKIAGGEYLIGETGSTVSEELTISRADIQIAKTYTADEDGNDDVGACNWVLTDQQTRLVLTVRDSDIPPASMSLSDYYSMFNSTAEEHVWVLLNYGARTAGQIFSVYFSKLHLIEEPVHGETDGIATQTLTFALSQDTTAGSGTNPDMTHKVWMGQS